MVWVSLSVDNIRRGLYWLGIGANFRMPQFEDEVKFMRTGRLPNKSSCFGY